MRSWAACWSTMTRPSRVCDDDIGLVDLRARGAERAVDEIAGRLLPRSAHRRSARRRRRRPGPARRALLRPRQRRTPGRRDKTASCRQSQLPGRGAKAGRNEAIAALAAVGRGAPAFAGEAFLQRMHDQRADEAGIAEAHFGLRGMHVGIDLARRQASRTAPPRDGGRAADSRNRPRAPRRGSACRAPGGR